MRSSHPPSPCSRGGHTTLAVRLQSATRGHEGVSEVGRVIGRDEAAPRASHSPMWHAWLHAWNDGREHGWEPRVLAANKCERLVDGCTVGYAPMLVAGCMCWVVSCRLVRSEERRRATRVLDTCTWGAGVCTTAAVGKVARLVVAGSRLRISCAPRPSRYERSV